MKFRKLALCVIIGIFVMNFAGIQVYAAETTGANDNQQQESQTEEESAETNKSNENVDATETSAEINLTATDSTENNDGTENNDSTEAANTTDSAISELSSEEDSLSTEENETSENTPEEDKNAEKAAKEKAKYSKADLRLLSALIYCEANSESYNGKLAVAIVVVNRKNSSRYPNTIKDVIYQKYQFSPVRNGSLKKALEEYDKGNFTSESEKECIKAAKAALSGTTAIKVNGKMKDLSNYLYFSGRLRNYSFKLGHHQFK